MIKRPSFTLRDIVKRFGGELVGDAAVRVSQVATLESAHAGDLAFLAQEKYLPQLRSCRASAVIIGAGARNETRLPCIVTSNPYAYFAKVSTFFNPPPRIASGVHKTVVIDKSARVAKSASIGPYSVLGKRVRVGDKAAIGAGCCIGDGASIGAGTRLHASVSIYHDCVIGSNCLVHSGAVIGADGFGIAQEDGVWTKIPQIGRVIIGNNVEIGANTTIDRGALDDTVIDDGVKLDNLIQIGHNVHIGAHTAIAACVGIAGSAKIGKHCSLGGAAMIHGHITIADGISVSPGTLIMKSLDKPGTYTGIYPFSIHGRWLKNAAKLRRLDELAARISTLERKSRAAQGDKS